MKLRIRQAFARKSTGSRLREMELDEFHRLLSSVAVPEAPLVQPENDLHPAPDALAFRVRLLEDRVAALEQRSVTYDIPSGASGNNSGGGR